MYPRAFEYIAPRSVDEAIALLTRHGDQAKVLAGGQSLLPLMKLRMSSPGYVIDLNRIGGLSGISEQKGAMVFGALTRHADIEDSAAVKSKLRLMHDAAAVIGDVQIRNQGTVGGSLAHADPAGDWPPAMLALNAMVTCRGPKGERSVALQDLLVDAYTTSLGFDEILTGVSVPLPPAGSGGAYLKFERKAGDFAVASVAVQLTMEGRICREIRTGLGAVGVTAIRAQQAEAILRGREVTPEALAKASDAAAAESDPFEDIRGPVEYKRQLVRVLFSRAVDIAMRRAKGEDVEVGHV